MPTVAVRIPQLGEGLQESLVIELFKKAGDTIKRDEPLYAMETDKGTIDVESPYDGVLNEWLVEEGTVHKIGAAIARMEVAEGVEEMAAGHGPPAVSQASPVTPIAKAASPLARAESTTTSKRAVPPRTRRYLREKGLQDVVDQIPAKGKKLTPEDIDAYLAGGGMDDSQTDTAQLGPFNDAALSKTQQRLNYRLVRGVQLCVPVVASLDVDFSAIENSRAELKADLGDDAPSSLVMVLWCITRAIEKHAAFRSTLVNEGRNKRTFEHVNLGIAVALPDDVLLTAVVADADTLSWSDFPAVVARQVELARSGEDQANAATTVSVSNIGSLGLRTGVAAVVPPAMGTITLGKIFQHAVPDGDSYRFTPTATFTLTFDHRVANGAGAASFLQDLDREIREFTFPA
jgi:pyruvate/2-oxoglutarate dehydrogenase complex dihydrolipoamide acyltransferase (E2) component